MFLPRLRDLNALPSYEAAPDPASAAADAAHYDTFVQRLDAETRKVSTVHTWPTSEMVVVLKCAARHAVTTARQHLKNWSVLRQAWCHTVLCARADLEGQGNESNL